MGLLRKILNKDDDNKSSNVGVVVCEFVQSQNFRGYRKAPIVTYSSNEKIMKQQRENLTFLKNKYGESFVGSAISFVNYRYAPGKGEGTHFLSVRVDDLVVGTVFDSCDLYHDIVRGKIDSAYIRIVQENIFGCDATEVREKAEMLVKYK